MITTDQELELGLPFKTSQKGNPVVGSLGFGEDEDEDEEAGCENMNGEDGGVGRKSKPVLVIPDPGISRISGTSIRIIGSPC